MKNMTKALIGTALAAGMALVATPAMADEYAPETVWQAWIMPQDSDWDQRVASEENLAALPCGTTWRIQNDEYLPEERDRFVADGWLRYGEDFGNEYQRGAISWYFSEYVTPACIPEAPLPEIGADVWDGEAICTSGAAERTIPTWSQAWHRDPSWNGTEWVFGDKVNDGEPVLVSTLTEPYESCLPEPPVVVPPVVPEQKPIVPVNEIQTLAETGSEDDLRFGVVATLAALALIIGGAYIVTKRRDHDDDNLA